MAARLSIGANRQQLIRQLLTESLILATIGGVAGLLVAQWTLHLIASILPPEATDTFKIALDPTVLLFAAVLTIGTGLLFGLFPALHSTRPDLASTLKGQSGQPSGAKGAVMFRTSLAVFQIAISMALLIAAGLFVKSLVKVSRVDLGLKTQNKVVIVNEAFVRKFNLGADAVGKMMTDEGETLDTQIIGVARDSKYAEVKDAVPALFFSPYKQAERVQSMTFYVRTAADPDQFVGQIPRILQVIDPNLPVEELRTLTDQARQNVFMDRFIGIMSTSFAVLATLLAAIGLYGVLAYTVAQRTREIGLRMALGAAPARVRLMILRQVGGMTIAGAAIGLLVALWIARLAEGILFDMQGRDPVVFAGATVTLTIVALAAGFIPAHRASKVDPMIALRWE